jgi:aryl-alcohol dehydrogenase-like predicted oxidoreductase
MELRPLGRSGITVSRLGLGAMVLGAWGNTDRAACLRIVRTALDRGVNLVDTADVYAHGESEEVVGEAISGRRDEVVLATKFHNPMGPGPNDRGNARRWIVRAVEASLRRLGTDRIDVYQVHRPDPETDLGETVDALSDLVRQGKIVTWGTSTFPASEIVEAQHLGARPGRVRPRTEQPPYSILCRGIEPEILPVCARYGMGVLVWSPLAGGWLTGKYTRQDPAPPGSRGATQPEHFDGGNPAKFDAVERLAAVAAEAGLSLTHLALAWVLEHPAVSSALIGPKTEAQLDELLGAADLRLTADLLDAVDAVVPPGHTINPADVGWTPPGLERRNRRRNP